MFVFIFYKILHLDSNSFPNFEIIDTSTMVSASIFVNSGTVHCQTRPMQPKRFKMRPKDFPILCVLNHKDD